MDANQRSKFNLRCMILGRKLFMTRFAEFNHNAIAFTRWLAPANELHRAQTGIRVYKPLWLDLLTAITGKALPNGNHDLGYIPFWADVFPRGKRYYILKHKNGSMEFCSF